MRERRRRGHPPGRARKGAGQNSFVDGGWAVANRDGVCTAPMHVRPSSDTATKAMPTRRPTAASGVRRTPAGVAGASARRRRGARRRAGAARAPASPVGNQPVSQGPRLASFRLSRRRPRGRHLLTSAPGRARDDDDEGPARGALRRRDEARQGRVQLPERRRGGVDDDGRGAARERGRGVEQTNGTARNADAALSLVKGEFDRRARGDERGERGRAAGGGRAGDGGGGRAGRREEDGYGRAPREDRLAQRRGSGLRARRQEVRPPG